MAIPTVAPYTAARDMMSLAEISQQLKVTGHPASVSTIRRWIERDGLHTERRRCPQGWRKDYVSYSDILMAHQEAVANRN